MTSLFTSLQGQRAVVTGATGSFGRHITHELIRQGALESLTIFSRDEERQRLLGLGIQEHGEAPFRVNFVLGDVRDRESVMRVARHVDVIINAAALKQVPACELNAMEAVKTNVLGMQNVLDAARENSVAQVLTISTDKAVEPINTMGMSKAMQERLVQSHALRYADTRVTVVRYGNVLGSTGSILPVFVDQLKKRGRLTVTHPGMTRFLLTLDDALGLVSTALASPDPSGTVYVRYASAVTVQDFADVVVKLLGGGDPVPVDVVGARPGDKAHEVLVSEDEMRRSRRVGDYFVIPPIVPTDTPGAGGTVDIEHPAFSSDVAPRMPMEEFEERVRLWCTNHGITLP